MNFGGEGVMGEFSLCCSYTVLAVSFLLSVKDGQKKSLVAGKCMALLSELCKIRI